MRLEAFGCSIERSGLRIGGRHELHRVVIERIDKNDEALRLITKGIVHDGNPVDEDRMKLPRNLEIVRAGQRLLAELTERKARDAHCRNRYYKLASHDLQLSPFAGMSGRQVSPGLIQCGRRRGIRGYMPGRSACQLLQPEVGAGSQSNAGHVLLDQVDEGHEQRAVESVLVKLARRHIRRRDYDYTELEQALEEAAYNHGIGDVGDVEFVETQEGKRP